MRDLDHALTLIEATVGAVSVPVTLKMRLGWDDRSHQRARARAPRRSGRRAHDHRARPHPLPVLQGQRRLGGGARGQAGGVASRSSSTATSAASTTPIAALAASGADAVMIGRARAGPAVASRARSRAISRPAGARPRRRSPTQLALDRRALRRDARASRHRASASATPASISAGRSTPRPPRAGVAVDTLKAHRAQRADRRTIRAAVRRRLARGLRRLSDREKAAA